MTATTRPSSGVFAGFANQSRREAASWRTSGRWWRQTLVWAAILSGLFVLMHWLLPAVLPADAGIPETGIGETAAQFTELAAVVTAVGVVLLTHGLILDERRNGVLEWLLSKPLTRPALVTAKFVGHSGGLLMTVVAVPWVAVSVLLGLAAGEPWPVGRTVAVTGMVGLLVVFHLGLVLAISTLTSGRVAVLAIPLVLIVGSDLVAGAIPGAFHLLPWSLGRVAGAYLAEGILVAGWPILATVGWTVVVIGVAIGRLTRTEL